MIADALQVLLIEHVLTVENREHLLIKRVEEVVHHVVEIHLQTRNS